MLFGPPNTWIAALFSYHFYLVVNFFQKAENNEKTHFVLRRGLLIYLSIAPLGLCSGNYPYYLTTSNQEIGPFLFTKIQIKNRRLWVDYSFKNDHIDVSITSMSLQFKSRDKQEYFTGSLGNDIE